VKREAEDLSSKLWSLINAVSKSASLPEVKAKRQQLKVITQSIEQLTLGNVPVPDDLPRLKKTLTDETEKAEGDQVVLFFLKEQLSQMLAAIDKNVDVKNIRTKE
jgi:hypothetical protein